ncbi:YciI family protein [Streptomyces sp. NPDC004647]|uniref:YciI family protein n=1 Tax=Streptomyces sp. NPDC004647 TaxID=3154671 RepID=UPI0033A43F8C
MCGRGLKDPMEAIVLIYGAEEDWWNASDEAKLEKMATFGEYLADLREAGVPMIADSDISLTQKATVVRGERQDGQTDGPSGQQQLIGYMVLEVKSFDEAVEWAEKVPFERVEVRINHVHDEALLATNAARWSERGRSAAQMLDRQRQTVREIWADQSSLAA